jgi:hypothetical protein
VRILGTPFLRRIGRRRGGSIALATAVAALLVAGGASGALKSPVPIGPNNGVVVGGMPAFAWTPVAGAEEYEFEIAADAGFNSPVLGRGKDNFRTKNTRATLVETAPNGTYWWRVRAIGRSGGASAWSRGRSFRKNWASGTVLRSPVGGAIIRYPTTPLTLSWSPVAGARKYLVSVATDPRLGSLVAINGAARPVETAATTLTPAAALAPGTYYWGLTPLDAQGNRGVPSPVGSFTWTWPSTTTLRVADLVAAPELYDPQFTWDRVPGAARYEVEINSSVDFAPGSKVCCTGTRINTSLSPTVVFKSNTYYWRVRAIDMDGHSGVWNLGPSFTKTFDNVPPVTAPSIKNLRMRDNAHDPGVDADIGSAGYQTQIPIVRWDPVPGASSYQVDVTPFDGASCLWSASPPAGHWTSTTAVTSWTPLGTGWNFTKPYPDPRAVATDSVPLGAGPHCVRVRARSDRASGQDVYGDYTYLDPNGLGWAFDWTGYPAGGACSPSCSAGYAGANDYLLPQAGTTTGQTPLFTWNPIGGAQSYFVIVSKDPSFTNIVDYAFTHLPAYAPRTSFTTTTYSDETTLYYWAILPEAGWNGTGGAGNPLLAAPRSFQKQSTPPTKVSPANGNVFLDQPRFQWTTVPGARTYRLQVSQDPSFGNPIDDVTTDSTAYSSNTTYPADTVLYWRVRANDENGVGLTWSNATWGPWTFQKRLGAPVGSAGNPLIGDAIPNWTWSVVPGAVSYDLSADLPDGTHRDFGGFRTPAVTPVLMYGTGIFHWRVRAEFPKSPSGLTPGPYSTTYSFTRTIREPTGARADFNRDHVLLSWNAKAGAKRYRIQISGTPDFGQLVENVLTDNTSYAPKLKYFSFRSLNTGRLYWRVAAQDEGDNVGDFTQPQLISRIRRMEIGVRGALKRGAKRTLTVTVSDFETAAGVPAATVRASGAGLRRRAARTSAFGAVRLVLRPNRRGFLVISASKRGYQRTSIRLRIR